MQPSVSCRGLCDSRLLGRTSGWQSPLEVGRAEWAGLGDEPPGGVHLLPDIPQQHTPYTAVSQIIDHALMVGLLPVGDDLLAVSTLQGVNFHKI